MERWMGLIALIVLVIALVGAWWQIRKALKLLPQQIQKQLSTLNPSSITPGATGPITIGPIAVTVEMKKPERTTRPRRRGKTATSAGAPTGTTETGKGAGDAKTNTAT